MKLCARHSHHLVSAVTKTSQPDAVSWITELEWKIESWYSIIILLLAFFTLVAIAFFCDLFLASLASHVKQFLTLIISKPNYISTDFEVHWLTTQILVWICSLFHLFDKVIALLLSRTISLFSECDCLFHHSFMVFKTWVPFFYLQSTWMVDIANKKIIDGTASIQTTALVFRNSALFASYKLANFWINVECCFTPYCQTYREICIISDSQASFVSLWTIFCIDLTNRCDFSDDSDYINIVICHQLLNRLNVWEGKTWFVDLDIILCLLNLSWLIKN